MKQIKVALIQSHIAFGNPDENYKHFGEQIKAATKELPDLIILPELWTTGYDLERIREIGDPNGERTKEFLREHARSSQTTIVGGSIAEIRADGVFNTTYVVNPQGEIISEYRKIHLFRLMDEEKYLSPGDQLSTFELGGHRFGLSICYDLRFPEMARTYALNGVKTIIYPAEWPHPRLHHWRTLLQARAIENQMFILSCNRVGKAGDTHFFGHSMAINPWGEILAEGSEEEEILTTVINLDEVEEVRSKIPVFTDRREELYNF